MDRGRSFVSHFKDLRVYIVARELSAEIFECTKRFPKEERYSLTDQVRRSSRSVGAQIAEAWGKRRYPAHFISKMTDADAEQLETQHWITVAFDSGYITEQQANQLKEKSSAVGKMIHHVITKAHLFCAIGGR